MVAEMKDDTMTAFVSATAEKFAIPGVAAGVWIDGRAVHACHGVTSVENPLPVDNDTLFLLGSLTETFTATTVMRLVAEWRVELAAPVRRYVPELALADERSVAEITMLNLLNHTSGLDFGLIADTGEGDDALAAYVAKMAGLEMIARPGGPTSYSQAGYNLAGRVVEQVTGMTFERAVASLVLEPLGLSNSLFARDDIMTRRFVVGHNRSEGGALSVARLWRRARGDNPGAGLASSLADQLGWARFHLGDGNGPLPPELLRRMQTPTAELRGSNLGDAIGIGWFLRDLDGVRVVGHGGSANGQFAELLLVPERGFAVASMSNAGPDGIPFNQEVVRWALEHYVGVRVRELEPLPYDDVRARQIVGRYENEVMTLDIDGDGRAFRLEVLMKPEIRAAADKELRPDHAPFEFSLLPGDADEYVITGGAFKGQRGSFTRDDTGAVVGVDLAGLLFSRARRLRREADLSGPRGVRRRAFTRHTSPSGSGGSIVHRAVTGASN
jgi:CubicO group peptidase (beta-lactamase class C family)